MDHVLWPIQFGIMPSAAFTAATMNRDVVCSVGGEGRVLYGVTSQMEFQLLSPNLRFYSLARPIVTLRGNRVKAPSKTLLYSQSIALSKGRRPNRKRSYCSEHCGCTKEFIKSSANDGPMLRTQEASLDLEALSCYRRKPESLHSSYL